MTHDQAKDILENLITGFWPDWNRTDAQYEQWLMRLRKYDYNKTKTAIIDIHFRQTINTKSPPAGKIFALLTANAVEKRAINKREPLLVYEIIKKGRKYGFKFSLPSGNEPNESQKKALEIEAENIRLNMDRMYGFEHIIKWYIDVLPF